MSLTRLGAGLLLLSLAASRAPAQSAGGGTDPFYADKIDPAEAEGEAPEGTLFGGSLTSTTFAYHELGGAPQGLMPEQVQNYSPASRLFTDMRARLDARHVSGSGWDVRLDGRVRVSPACAFASPQPNYAALYPQCRTQSGALGGNEYDVRELYARRAGASSDLYLGRQYAPELGELKLDGARYQYHLSDNWSVSAAGGLHPARGSRSIVDDYPFQELNNGVKTRRITPFAAGLAGAYRYGSLYGSVGAAGIVTLANQRYEPMAREPARVFVTGSGYWRPLNNLDVYHYAVLDLAGAGGTNVTNGSLGVNYQPAAGMHVTAAINRVDTETLNVLAQNVLADPDNVQPSNEHDVRRLASQSVRLGVSAALAEQRYEISTSAEVRWRDEIIFYRNAANKPYGIPAGQSAEVMVRAVDRRSVMGWRLGASVSRIFGIGINVNRATVNTAGLTGSHSFRNGRGEVDAELSMTMATDENRLGAMTENATCGDNLLNCYGTASVFTVSAGSTVFYRLAADWLVMGSATLGRQGFSRYILLDEVSQPANWLITAMARLGYRF